ncbi:MAG: peptidyl-prolyl cis-trans isomerase [Fidelibacterota bacterium]
MRFIVLWTCTLLLVACTKPASEQPVIIARVNDHVLTVEDFQLLQKNYSDPNLTPNHIVSRWIMDEVLYQTALEHAYDKDRTLQSMVDEYRRKLLGDSVMEELVTVSNPLSGAEIKAYYEENKSSFRRLVDEAKVYHFAVPSLNEARNIARILKQKRSGGELKALFVDYDVSAAIVKKGFLLPALDDLIFQARNRQVLGPIQIDDRYHVIEILKQYPAGSIISLDEAYDEIQQQLIQKRILLTSRKILDSLMARNNIETYLENITQ